MRLAADADLAPFNTLRIPARARVMAQVDHWYEIERVLSDPRLRDLPCLVLGEGSNVLFRDDYPGLVLRIANRGRDVLDVGADGRVLVRVAAGENWHGLVLWTASRGLWGIENLALIPGTCGAAPIQNIGAYGAQLSDSLVSVRALDRTRGTWRDFDAQACRLGYRTSRFREDPDNRWCITEILLALETDGRPRLGYPGVAASLDALEAETIGPADMAAAISGIRQRKLPNPRVTPNCGSFFKNPVVAAATAEQLRGRSPSCPCHPAGEGLVKLSAAWLIDQCGLKGQRVGGAAVSDRHALVLINSGGATGKDVWQLALDVQARVFDRFGIRLEPEPQIV
ncbi:MAG: UDP-N-acetylmuramate dehydrogenase [Pseudomonadota bacterium]